MIGRPDLAASRNSPGCARAEPASQSLIFHKRSSQRRKHSATDSLLLLAQVVFKKLVPSDVAGVHSGNRVIHQELRIDLGHTGGGRDGSECLSKVIAPL